MFGWFESRLNPYPDEEPKVPPQGLFAFCWHYTKPAAPWLFVLGTCSMLIAVGEVFLYQFLGNIVDWLSIANRETFLQDEKAHADLDGGAASGRPAAGRHPAHDHHASGAGSAIIR